MSGPALIVVTGYPASGKTSVGEDLARRLGLVFFNKDGVKEILFDVLGVGDLAWSRRLGRAAIAVLLHQAERSLAGGFGAVVEANFDRELGSRELAEVTRSCGARPIQVVVTADPDELVRRYRERIESGERHPGHLDAALADEHESMVARPYPPLDLEGPVFTFDTSSDPDFEELVRQVRASL